MQDSFLTELEKAAESKDAALQCRLISRKAHCFFATPDTASCWEIVKNWDLSACKVAMPILIQGWLAFLCGDRPALAQLAPRLVDVDNTTASASEQSLWHALHALSGLEAGSEKRLCHAEQAVAVLDSRQGHREDLSRSDNAVRLQNKDPISLMALANAKLTLAQVLAGQEQVRRAAALFEESEALFRTADLPFPAAVACTNALLNHFRLGRYQLVLERAQRVLSDVSAFHGLSQTWWRIVRLPAGMACCELLKPALAVAHLRDALSCIDEMRLFHMHGLAEWYLFLALWLQGDMKGLLVLREQCEALFAPMHHPFLDLMMSQFRLLLAEAQTKPLPPADVESMSLEGPADGAAGMWVREEMLSWLAIRGYPELMTVASLLPILAKLRHAGNVPRLQGFLVAQARLLLRAGEVSHAETCLREAISLWRESGGAAGFALFPHGETAMLRVLAPALHTLLTRVLRNRDVCMVESAAVVAAEAPATPATQATPAIMTTPAISGTETLPTDDLRSAGDSLFRLTRRERDILGLAAQGLNNADIAKALFVGTSTVKWHINHIFSKLGAENRIQAIRIAQARGEIPEMP